MVASWEIVALGYVYFESKAFGLILYCFIRRFRVLGFLFKVFLGVRLGVRLEELRVCFRTLSFVMSVVTFHVIFLTNAALSGVAFGLPSFAVRFCTHITVFFPVEVGIVVCLRGGAALPDGVCFFFGTALTDGFCFFFGALLGVVPRLGVYGVFDEDPCDAGC